MRRLTPSKRPVLTAEERQLLRVAVSEASKARLPASARGPRAAPRSRSNPYGTGCCSGCGCDLDIYVFDCRVCLDRRRKRAHRVAGQ